MNRLTFVLLLTILLAPTLTRAQETAPWPPDPAQIFAEGVEIVSMEIIEPQPIPENPYPVADDTARVVRVYDLESAQWREFPYPDEVVSLMQTGIRTRSDGTLVFNEPYSAPEEGTPEIWVLSPTTSEFSRAEIVCGWKVKALPHEGEWILVWENDDVVLCFTETGSTTQPLPKNIEWSTGTQVRLSPDGEWLALMTFGGEHPNDYADVYGYEINTGLLNSLGRIEGLFDDIAFEHWLGNTHIAIYNGEMPEIFQKDIYDADVTQPDSLRYGLPGLSRFYDDPPRYEYITTTAYLTWKYGVEVEHEPCQLTLYNADGIYQHNLGYDCIGNRVLRVSATEYLYVQVTGGRRESSLLSLVDNLTGNITNLIEGEIEWLQSVSPDGRYALLVMDGNQKIDLADYYFDYVDWRQLPTAYLAVFDMVNLKLVYASTPFSYQGRFFGGWSSSWCGDDCLILSVFGKYSYTSLITLEEAGVNETRVNGVGLSYSDDDGRDFRLTADKELLLGRIPSSLIDFRNTTLVPLLVQGAHVIHDIDLDWIDDGRIKVTVYPKNRRLESNAPSVIYVIDVP